MSTCCLSNKTALSSFAITRPCTLTCQALRFKCVHVFADTSHAYIYMMCGRPWASRRSSAGSATTSPRTHSDTRYDYHIYIYRIDTYVLMLCFIFYTKASLVCHPLTPLSPSSCHVAVPGAVASGRGHVPVASLPPSAL